MSKLNDILAIFESRLPQKVNNLLPSGFYQYPYPTGLTDPWTAPYQTPSDSDISSFVAPVQLDRYRHDAKLWREAVNQAELAFYPQRVDMQRMYLDTMLNPHVLACWLKRQNLTLLRSFEVIDVKKEKSETLTDMLKTKWFYDYLRYTIDAIAYGYNLIQLGDLQDGQFTDISITRRHNISPDRKQVAIYLYAITGINIDDPRFEKWVVWTPTPTEFGVSPCGYGLLYKIADIEILHRNTIIANADFCDLFGKPYRHAKTDLKGVERTQLEGAMDKAGINQWIVTDKQTEIDWLQSNGQGSTIYKEFRESLQALISKVLLGHADAIDSVAQKLGNSGKSQPGGAMTPAAQSLSEIQTIDGRFVEHNVNFGLFPKLRKLGFGIPEGYKFQFMNDDELVEARMLNDTNNLITAQVVAALKQAGFTTSEQYLSELMQMPITAAPEPATPEQGAQESFTDMMNRLDLQRKRKLE